MKNQTRSVLRQCFIVSILFLAIHTKIIGQTTLAQGDISIIGWNSSISRGVSFVTWVNLQTGTEIRFTDNGFNSSGLSTAASNIRWQETVLIWTATSAITAGSVITITDETTNTGAANVINSTGLDPGVTALGLSNNGGDQIFAYQGLNMPTTTTATTGNQTFNNTILFGLGYRGNSVNTSWITSGTTATSTSYLPSDLVSPNRIYLGTATVTAGEYTGPRSGFSSAAVYKSLIEDPANWTLLFGLGPVVTYTTTSFSLGSPPAISSNPANATVCSSGNTTFSITASNTSSYQWYENSGAGFTSISNGGIYSGATTATLSLTGVTAGMSGYAYRCVASGPVSPSATSTIATLTVNTPGAWLGTTSKAWSNTANWLCGVLPTSSTDVSISNSAPNMPEVDITTAVCRNVTIASGASVTINSGKSLSIYGSVSNSGTFTSAGKTIFSGGSQTIPGGNYTDLEIAGTGTKPLSGSINVSGVFTLTASKLQLGNFNITVGSSGSTTSGSSSSYVITNGTGALIQQNLGLAGRTGSIVFPIGTSSSFNPLTITNAGTADNFGARVGSSVNSAYNSSDVPTGTVQSANAVGRTWFITEAVAGGSDVSLVFQWNGSDELAGFNRSQAFASHYTGGQWNRESPSTVSGSNPYTINMSNVHSFSPFGVGSTNSVLPLDLLSFAGREVPEGVQLQWTTANERNASAFDIERTINNQPTMVIGTIMAGAGNPYKFTDLTVTGKATATYRLKMRDIDGRFSYSPTITVKYNRPATANFAVYPIPATGAELFIKPLTGQYPDIEVTISDMSGRVVLSKIYNGLSGNYTPLAIPVGALGAGTFVLNIAGRNGERLLSVKFTRGEK